MNVEPRLNWFKRFQRRIQDMKDTNLDVKLYNRKKHVGIEFSYKPDDISLDDEHVLRSKLSCGHFVDPNSLTSWCKNLVNDGYFEFHCPAIVSRFEKCNKKWEYSEVRKLALLDKTEQDYFEIKLSENAADKIFDYKKCPNCQSFVERTDCNDLKTVCSVCLVLTQQIFEFCWQCENKWIETTTNKQKDTCGRLNCINKKLQALAECKLIQLGNIPQIPSIRACTTCGFLIEHDGTNCKNVICERCKVEFCFSCLNLTEECENQYCRTPVQIQLNIPIWDQK
jgi:hypothetical protein